MKSKNIKNNKVVNSVQIVLILLLTISSLLPPGADATLCFNFDESVHMHLDLCDSEHASSHEETSEIHEDHCKDLKILCALDPTIVSYEDVKIKLKNSSHILNELFLATIQNRSVEIPPTTVCEQRGILLQEHTKQIRSIILLI